jgi:RNA polymerase subunit RPABC4/transcription elongation factor Spt4
MSILDDVLANVKSYADVAGKKVNKVVDVSKLRITISQLNSEIAKRYRELGEYVYDSKKNGDLSEEEVTLKIAEIDDLYAQISVIAKQVADIENKAICPECGRQIPVDSAFCSFCGSKIEHEEPVVEEPEEVEVDVESAVEIVTDEASVEETNEEACPVCGDAEQSEESTEE